MRQLSHLELERLSILTAAGLDSGLLEVTETGLKKSILDATAQIRSVLVRAGTHDFGQQMQGQAHKVQLDAHVHSGSGVHQTSVSLYRPETKEGDPRLWIYGLKRSAVPNDVIVIVPDGSSVHVFNLSESAEVANRLVGLLADQVVSERALELLSRLRVLAASGPLVSVMKGRPDTAVGRTIESALGIEMNSSPEPDYYGIELKAGRAPKSGRGNRKNLFAKVPDWSVSPLGSSERIVEELGYDKEGARQLYCTVSAAADNSQGLSLRLDEERRLLLGVTTRPDLPVYAVWDLSVLETSLHKKHRETFWIEVDAQPHGDREQFQLQKVTHTQRPIISQLGLLLGQSKITVDHLISRKPGKSASEKGPLFKIWTEDLPLLFPRPLEYTL